MNRQFDPCGPDPFPTPTPQNAPEILDQLLESPPCTDVDRELRRLGFIIDLSDDLGREDVLETAIEQGQGLLEAENLEAHHAALSHYYLGNAWEAKRRLNRSEQELHEWEQPELEKQIIHLRWGVRLGTEAKMDKLRLCQMYTNLGNLLSHCGRVVEALSAWDAALRIDPDFGMALGNRALGLLKYAGLCHDAGHRALHFREAHKSAASASESEDEVHQEIIDGFDQLRVQIEESVPSAVLENELPIDDFPSDWSQEESAYRRWCLRKRLFLNDLNDLELGPIAAADVLTLPSLTTSLDAGQPSALGFFNQLKQEFVSARYLYFSGTRGSEVHFSDRDVKLLNTLDYPTYGLWVEKVKLAFRVSYSLFDKVAYFLNDYLRLGIRERDVSFRSLWYKKRRPKNGLRDDLHLRNHGLKGLFWLSKDLYEKSEEFTEAIEPEAREIATIRNHLEHKYLKLHEYRPPEPASVGFEELAYSLSRSDFEKKALRSLQLARAALIYLSQAVYAEESRRTSSGNEGPVGPMFLPEWEDDWKL